MKKNKITINFLYQIAYQILTIILPLITTPYISRVLGAEKTGIYSYTFVVANYFLVFAALGIETYGNRIIASARIEGQDKINYIFSSVFFMHAISSIIAIIGYALYIIFFVEEYKIIAVIQSLLVISALFDVNWFFFGVEEFKLTVIRNTIVKILTIFAMFIFVHKGEDLWKYTLIMATGTLISQSCVWMFIPKYVRFVKVSFKDILVHFKPLCILFFAVIATSLYRMIDKLMIGWTGDMNALGTYEYADRIIRMLVTVITALGTVMLPRMSTLYAQQKEDLAKKYLLSTTQFSFVMSFALAFGIASISNEFLVIFLGDGYSSAVDLIKILSISIPIMGWNNLVRTQILMPKYKDLVYTNAVWTGAIIDVILNAILIFTIGVTGAAVSTVIAYLVVGIFQTFPLKNEYNITALLKYSVFPFFSGFIMYLLVRVIGTLMGSSIMTVIIEIFVGGMSYVIMNAFYLKKSKNEIFIRFWNKIFMKED